MTQEKSNSFERHTQTILTAIIAGLIAWVGLSVTEQGKLLATLTERVSALQVQVETLSNRPTLTGADFGVLITPIKTTTDYNRQEIVEIKNRVKKLEEDLYIKYLDPRKKMEK